MDNKVQLGTLSMNSSPHIVTKLDTAKTMKLVLLALLPAFCVSIYVFGPRVIALTAVCVIASVFFEWAYEKLMKRPITIADFSACVTGVLLAFNLPSSFPFWMAVIGSFVSIVIVKQLFGGIGKNFANPAIVGRIVLMLSFTSQMTTWPTPRGVDGTTGATPLALMESGQHLANLKAMFLGTTGGCLGEVSALALLIGGIFLIAKKIIDPIIQCSVIGTVFVFSLLYYGIKGSDAGALHMALYNILAGGVMLGAFFCATDYVTSPIMNNGKLIFGIGIGLFTMLIRLFCNYPEGVSFSILFMNLFVPLIDRATIKRYYASLYGGAKK